MTLIQKASCVLDEKGEVVLRNSRTDLYTLYFLLLALLILALLPFQILVPTVVDDLDDRRLRGGGNHDEVQTLISCLVQRLSTLHDAELLPFGANHAYVSILQDTAVNFGAGFGAGRSSKSCYVVSP